MYIDSYLANGPSLVLIKNVTNWEPLYNVIYVWIKLSPFFTLNAHLVCVFILQAGSAKQLETDKTTVKIDKGQKVDVSGYTIRMTYIERPG